MTAPWILGVVVGATGLCLGSFVTTAAIRAAAGQPWTSGRSHCDNCGRGLSYLATVPVASYAAFGGACTGCGSRIDALHPIGEICAAAIALGAVGVLGLPRALIAAPLGLILLASAVFDSKTQRLPDALTAIAAMLCAALTFTGGPGPIWQGLLASAVALVGLELMRRGFAAVRGRSGLGFGDVKLIAAGALWLGPATLWAVTLAACAGLAGVALSRPRPARIAFGPYLAASIFVVGLAREAHPWP